MTRLTLLTLTFVLWAANSFAQAPPVGLAAELEAVEHALALSPDSASLLRTRATLATWAGQYDRAEDAYRRLAKLHPDDQEIVLSLARVLAWGGRTNAAVGSYRQYLRAAPDAAPIWIELSRTEMWRGNFGAALEALETYQRRFGRDDAYAAGLAAVLARAGRPRQALALVEPLLAARSDDYELQVTRAIALAGERRAGEAFDALHTLQRLKPNASETRAIEHVVRETLASTGGAGVTSYRDSSTLEVERIEPRVAVTLGNGTTLGGGAEAVRLRAGQGSGLEQVDGSESASHDAVWITAAHQLRGVNVRGQVGQARTSADTMAAYALGVDFTPFDGMRISVDRQSGFLVVSPRTVGLGLRQVSHAGRVEWAPGARLVVAFDGRVQSLSDDNRRWELTVAPRYSVARTDRLNLDLGVTVSHLAARMDVDHGYWDPSRYQYYGVTAYPYWKVRDTIGVGLSVSFGLQAEGSGTAFRPGGHATAEATFGIFRSWALKATGAGSFNQRLNSGAFDGFSTGLSLVRRF